MIVLTNIPMRKYKESGDCDVDDLLSMSLMRINSFNETDSSITLNKIEGKERKMCSCENIFSIIIVCNYCYSLKRLV